MCVVLSTTTSFFLWVSPRSEYGYFSRDEKGGSGWPVDRRGHARIGSQGYQSTEDKQHQQRRWRQRLRDDQEVQARHIQCEMGRLWKHKSQRRYHVHVCRGDRLLRRAGSRETDRYTLEGPNHHANRVDGRGWASGAYFGALAVVMVVGGICECSLQSNWSVAKAGFCNFFCNNFCNFKAVCNPPSAGRLTAWSDTRRMFLHSKNRARVAILSRTSPLCDRQRALC